MNILKNILTYIIRIISQRYAIASICHPTIMEPENCILPIIYLIKLSTALSPKLYKRWREGGRKVGGGRWEEGKGWVQPKMHCYLPAGLSGSVGCAVPLETRRSRVQPPPRSATFFLGDWSWNIFSPVILPLPLIQEGQLSVSGERMCTILVNRLRGLSLPSKRVAR